MDEGWAIILAAFMATAGIGYSAHQQRKLLRRQHTYLAIERHNQWSEFDQKLDNIRMIISSHSIPHPDNESRISDIQDIDFILNYYEFLSAAIWSGDMDERLVRECEHARLGRIVIKLGAYIRANQIDSQDDTMWENLLKLNARWSHYPNGTFEPFELMIELIVGRPVSKDDYHEFWKRDFTAEIDLLDRASVGAPPSISH